MCVLAGYFLDVSDEESILEWQLELLAHRGPDSFGTIRAVARGDKLDEFIAAHMCGQAKLRPPLWTLLTLEVYLRKEAS